MNKITKWTLGALAVILVVAGGAKGVKEINTYFKGEPWPFNSILVSGNIENIDKAKEVYKDNTKYTKNYKYKTVTKTEKVLDENGKALMENGKEVTYEYKYLVITKDTAKEMLKDELIRVRKSKENDGNLDTEVLKNIPNIDGDKSIFFGRPDTEIKFEVNGKQVPTVHGIDGWIGYYGGKGTTIITDDDTYKSINEEENYMSLIRFKKGKMNVRNAKDKESVNQKLSNVKGIEIDYANVED
ncbi:lipoprotein BA_5634 family protein [Paraclostridium ghonii]|uniref:lipoprotein BA_5634 family protein n=1 Tax=Paraclostridium ghonii TaxID=29358 RepID=UPI00202CEBA7|nr:lipoprotein BA_5634 family protein [Paeniclostridium ghonii]MCM0167238.1 lipoprotein BA_5634 family protein [Paeniclostridium ghonii]